MRGCPFGCEFCEIIAFLGRRVTTRNVPAAIEDLTRAIDTFGVRRVHILDDTFTVSKRRVLEICRSLRRADLGVEFEIFSRTNTLDEETMAALAEAGCVRVFFGIDGGDDEVLSRISKGIRIVEAEQVLRTAAGYFDVTASFIWGYPFEAWPAFERMMVLVHSLRSHEGRFPIWPQIHLLSPSAGTPLFDKYGHTLLFDESVELLPVGTRLDSYDHRPEYEEVRALIASDKVLAAPFWRYPTPDFERKLLAVEHFNRDHDAEVGARVLRELETLELVC
jgi:radical SAM superfamily enzyme YgiQ (UPF0313 family)